MDALAPPPLPTAFPLRGGGAIELHEGGVGHPRSVRFGGGEFTPWESVTHVTVGPGGLRLGSLRGSFLFRTADFAENGAHRTLAAALRERIAALPDGAERVERMAALDRLARARRRTPVSAAVVAACLVAAAVSLLAPPYHEAGVFSALLVRLGETWRLVTASFLHAGKYHLVLNVALLAVLGALAERSLGSRTYGAVLALAGVGAAAGSVAAGYSRSLGASGLVAGVIGALLWIEFRRPGAVPVGWRLPRRIFVGAVVLDNLILALFVPDIAHATHAGGFAGGLIAAAALGPTEGRRLAPVAAVRAVNAAALAAVGAATFLWIQSVRAPDPAALARRGETLLEMPDVSPGDLNNQAWTIAISRDPSPAALEIALRMAERAVRETQRRVPATLDTLAELHFLRGEADLAIEIGHEAVALAPSEPYYREQLRRFAGERAADDRPEAPPEDEGPPPRRPRPYHEPDEPGPGIRV